MRGRTVGGYLIDVDSLSGVVAARPGNGDSPQLYCGVSDDNRLSAFGPKDASDRDRIFVDELEMERLVVVRIIDNERVPIWPDPPHIGMRPERPVGLYARDVVSLFIEDSKQT
jgi:hypothetical protein